MMIDASNETFSPPSAVRGSMVAFGKGSVARLFLGCFSVSIAITRGATPPITLADFSVEMRERIFDRLNGCDYAALLRTGRKGHELMGATDVFERRMVERCWVDLRAWASRGADGLLPMEKTYGAVRTLVHTRSGLPLVPASHDPADLACTFLHAFHECAALHEGAAWRKNCMAALIIGNILPVLYDRLPGDFRASNLNLMLQAAALNGDIMTLDFIVSQSTPGWDLFLARSLLDDIVHNGSVKFFLAIQERVPEMSSLYPHALFPAILYQQTHLFQHVLNQMLARQPGGTEGALVAEVFSAACMHGGLKMARMVVEHYSAHVDTRQMSECLARASRTGALSILEYFLGCGQEGPGLDREDFAVMIVEAARGNRVEVLEFLLHKLQVHRQWDLVDSLIDALNEAAFEGHIALLDLLLGEDEHGAMLIPVIEPSRLQSLVQRTGHAGRLEILQCFHQKQAMGDLRFTSLNFAVDNGKMLISACQAGNLCLVKYLLSLAEGGDGYLFPDITADGRGTAALMAACERGHLDIVKELLQLTEAGTRVHLHVNPAVNGHKPLLIACHNGHVKVVEFLLSGTPAADDTLEYTFEGTMEALREGWPLREAACQGHVDVVRLLLLHRGVGMHPELPVLLCVSGRSDMSKILEAHYAPAPPLVMMPSSLDLDQ